MRLRLVTVAILLAVASGGHGRPKHPDPLDNGSRQEANVGSPDSRKDHHREVKNIHTMDQSLRTVATQLLNATAKREDLIRIPEEQILSVDSPMQIVHISTQVEDVDIDEIKKDLEDNGGKMKFGIPVNSKFGHFELSNPGQAMAMTEEELEREMATATAATRQKTPTTTSMLSTWIQLYPPSTTTQKPLLLEEKIESQNNIVQTSASTKSAPAKSTTTGKPIRKAETKPTTKFVEKTTEASASTPKITKTVTSSTTNFIKVSTTTAATSVENDVEETFATEKKPQTQRTTASASTTTKSVTKKPPKSTTPKSNSTIAKNSTSKPPRTNNPNRIKPFSTRRPPANKNDTVTSTSKIEKVTIKPATTFAQNAAEHIDKPAFVTKIKASVLADAQKPTTPIPSEMKPVNSILSKSNFTNVEHSETKVPTPAKVNNVLKVHLKKPIDDTTKIEIQPIRVNPPVLTIEKFEDTSSDQKPDNEDKEVLENSKIDVKFDFDPEVSTIQVQTISAADSTLSTSPSTTTKKPRTSNKRKRNKNRRRKPSTTTSSTTTTVATVTKPTEAEDDDTTSIDALDLEDLLLSGIQESKIEPESKAPPSKKKKPSNQTQVQKPIGTQIYNFLSREVMPSVGVMSLVGLGLGLASYFLYPFGGGITRRNYEVEPNYKYNLDEYGGNYGLSEEEVLSKVYSGMTPNNNNQNHETKYSNVGVVGEKNPNYYKYSSPEQPQQQQATRYPTPTATKPHQNRVIYRPVETTSYDVNYRNTEFKYPDVPTTPNYYERQRVQQQQHQQQEQQQQSADFVPSIGKVAVGKNRQFVVGNVPKEYSSSEALEVMPMHDKVEAAPQYQADEAFPNQDMPISPMPVPENLKNIRPEALVGNIEDMQSAASYDDLEMNPSAVAIEHGPRALKSSIRRKRGIISKFLPINIPKFMAARKERSSVIQVIPSKGELEQEKKKQEQENDLSNEILDIIDEALPGESDKQKKRHEEKDSMNKHHTMDSDQPLKISIKSAQTGTTAAPTTTAAESASPSSTTTTTTTSTVATTKESEVKEATPETATTTTTTSTTENPTESDTADEEPTTLNWLDNVSTTAKPQPPQRFDIISFARKIAEIKLRLGLTILKHASEGFARYVGDMQKRFNKEE